MVALLYFSSSVNLIFPLAIICQAMYTLAVLTPEIIKHIGSDSTSLAKLVMRPSFLSLARHPLSPSGNFDLFVAEVFLWTQDTQSRVVTISTNEAEPTETRHIIALLIISFFFLFFLFGEVLSFISICHLAGSVPLDDSRIFSRFTPRFSSGQLGGL